jgi:SAM-dependent methyltransferase
VNDLSLRETLRFLERFLPAAPARVLEVGAGDGALARSLAARAYAVTALDESLDPEVTAAAALPAGTPPIVWVQEDFLQFQPTGLYDVVLFTRSLHHIQPTGRALDKALEALAPEGVLLAEEVAIDRVNAVTARWLYDLEAVLIAAEVIAEPEPAHAAETRPLARWRLEHAWDPPLASGHDMLAAARERFDLTAVEEAPYLYRYLAARAREGPRAGPRARRVVEALFELESRLIRERDIAAAGLRFAGRRRDSHETFGL